ncbi:MAG: DUF5309 family protein [candidate division Zixibacteria bacterium]|nr:DUF5309 family protein [candidate division Zixibacteria bacterium]
MAAIATIIAQGGTGNWPTTNELKIDMSKQAFQSFSELTPLTTILTKTAMENAFNFQVDLLEKHDMPVALTNSATITAAGTTATITTGYAACVEGTLLYNPRADDIAYVSATPTSASVTIVRSYAGTTEAIWNAGDALFLLPTTIPENDSAYDAAASAQMSQVYNYIQLVRMNLNITRLQDEMQLNVDEKTRTMLQTQKYREYRQRKELGLMFGGRASTGTAPATIRTSGGCREYLLSGTNYKDFAGSGGLTETSWDDYLNDFFTENYDAGDVFCPLGPKAKGKILNWGKAKGRVELDKDNSNKYGFKIDTYDYDGKLVRLVRSPLLNQSTITSGWGFLLDMNRLKYKILVPDTLHEDIIGIRSEAIIDCYRGAGALLLANENKHGMFVGGN